MKYIGIDYGTKRVGIAISDDSGSFAFAKSVVSNPDALKEVVRLSKENDIKTAVIGESVANNGLENKISSEIKKFASKLEEYGLSTVFVNEGYSSVEAYRYQDKKGQKDDSAAAIILQRYLDKLAGLEKRNK